MRCDRTDGSVTWQRHGERNAGFFPLHDLTHYAVETTLGFRGGFFGLVAAGWDIVDTTGKGSRGSLPEEAILVEHLAGYLDRERTDPGEPLAADVFNEQLRAICAASGLGEPPEIDAGQLAAIRTLRDDLTRRWSILAPGAALELHFPDADGDGPDRGRP